MLSKKDKLKLILDVKNDRITKKILNILKNPIIVFVDRELFCEKYNLPPDEFDEVYNYIEKLHGWKIIGLGENN